VRADGFWMAAKVEKAFHIRDSFRNFCIPSERRANLLSKLFLSPAAPPGPRRCAPPIIFISIHRQTNQRSSQATVLRHQKTQRRGERSEDAARKHDRPEPQTAGIASRTIQKRSWPMKRYRYEKHHITAFYSPSKINIIQQSP
jgi:hypothetical protein